MIFSEQYKSHSPSTSTFPLRPVFSPLLGPSALLRAINPHCYLSAMHKLTNPHKTTIRRCALQKVADRSVQYKKKLWRLAFLHKMGSFNSFQRTTNLSSQTLQRHTHLHYTLHTCCILVASQGHESTILHIDPVIYFSTNYTILIFFVHPVVYNPLHTGSSTVLG